MNERNACGGGFISRYSAQHQAFCTVHCAAPLCTRVKTLLRRLRSIACFCYGILWQRALWAGDV